MRGEGGASAGDECFKCGQSGHWTTGISSVSVVYTSEQGKKIARVHHLSGLDHLPRGEAKPLARKEARVVREPSEGARRMRKPKAEHLVLPTVSNLYSQSLVDSAI